MTFEPVAPLGDSYSSTPDDVSAMYERMKEAGRTWVIGINLFDLKYGPNVYDEGLHGDAEHPGDAEPGYRDAFAKALDMQMRREAQRMDFAEYMRLHATIVPAGIRHNVPEGLRGLKNTGAHCGFVPTMMPLSRTYAVKKDIFVHDTERQRLCFVPRSEAFLQAEIERVLNLKNQAMDDIARETAWELQEKREYQIEILAACHQYLEFLHPTIDCNTRRHLVMLSGWLRNIGLAPPILMHSALVHCTSPAGWAELIRWGSQIFRDMSTMDNTAFAACCQAPPSMTKGTLRSFHYKKYRQPAFLEKLLSPLDVNSPSDVS